MANMKAGLGICGVIVLTVLPVDGEGPLRVAVTPIHSFAPATVTIRARIEPSAENRMLAIVADGDDFYRSSEIQLDGVHAPKIVELRFSNLPRRCLPDLCGLGGWRRTSARYRSPVGERYRNGRQPLSMD